MEEIECFDINIRAYLRLKNIKNKKVVESTILSCLKGKANHKIGISCCIVQRMEQEYKKFCNGYIQEDGTNISLNKVSSDLELPKHVIKLILKQKGIIK